MKRLSSAGILLALTLAACGGGSDNSSSEASSTPASSGTPVAPVTPVTPVTPVEPVTPVTPVTPTATTVSGVAATGKPLAGATIKVCDAKGSSLTTTAASDGTYSLNVSSLTAPLMISATNAAFININNIPQPANGTIAYAAILDALTPNAANTANVNQLTDKIASDVASTDLALKGSVQLINLCNTAGVTSATVTSKTNSLRSLFETALSAKGVSAVATFDPVKTAMVANGKGFDAVLDMVIHKRDGWGSATDDQLRGTKLYDRNAQEISDSNVKLDPTQKAWAAYGRRIFIVGDSTASNYPASVAPRMGWGQVFDRMLKSSTDVKVVNLAQSGRSSRSFITEGWFKELSDNVQAGDYVLIQWGHNDEKCTTTGTLDWANRCTYPNDDTGKVQISKTIEKLPAGVTAEDLSFQRSLEKYIKAAKDKGAIPVLLTPITRMNQDKLITAYAEGAFPITKSTHITTKGDFFGNYSQTIIDTATANSTPVIDIDAKTITFFNGIGVGTGGVDATGGWRDYYLAVKDPVSYPFYATSAITGHYMNADRTHTQENGAVKIAEFVAEGIKAETTSLAGLITLLK